MAIISNREKNKESLKDNIRFDVQPVNIIKRNDEKIEFEFTFYFHTDFVSENVKRCDLKIGYDRKVKKPSYFEGQTDPAKLVQVLTSKSKSKENFLSITPEVLHKGQIPITKNIDFTTVGISSASRSYGSKKGNKSSSKSLPKRVKQGEYITLIKDNRKTPSSLKSSENLKTSDHVSNTAKEAPSSSYANAAMIAIVKHGIDPGAISSCSLSVSQRASSNPGVISRRGTESAQFKKLQSNDVARQLLVNQKNVVHSARRLQLQKVQIERIYTKHTELISIDNPKRAISSPLRFKLRFELNSGKFVVVEKIIDISRILKSIKFADLPPSISVCKKSKGVNAVTISAKDPEIERVMVYRKTFGIANKNLSYIKVGDFNVADLTSTTFNDRVNQNFPCIYRIIYKTVSGEICYDFESAVVKGENQSLTNNAILCCYNLGLRGIDVKLKNISNASRWVKIFRKDITSNGEEILVNRIRVRGTKEITFPDNINLLNSHTYEYRIEITDQNGDIENLPTKSRVKFIKPTISQEEVQINARHATTTKDGENQYSVNFLVSITTPNPIKNEISNALAAADLSFESLTSPAGATTATAADEDAIIYPDLKSLIRSFTVKRVNESTGEVAHFGVHHGTKFSDSREINDRLGITPYRPSDEYVYIFEAVSKSAISLFNNRVLAKDENLRQNYYVNMGKFDNPAGRRTSTIQSSNSFEGNASSPMFSNNPLENGESGIVSSARVTKLPIPKPSVKLTATDIKGKTVLTLDFKGNIQMIDHVLILVEKDGIRAPISSILVPEGNQSIKHVEFKTRDDVGIRKYFAKIIHNDFSVSKSSKKVVLGGGSVLPSFAYKIRG